MKYYLYRLKYNEYLGMMQTDAIKNTAEHATFEQGDKVIIIVAKSLTILGAYVYNSERNAFELEKKINKNVTLFYERLPMVTYINDRTYKLFAKPVREIDQENYEAFL